MARKQDMTSGSGATFSGKTSGSRGISSVPAGVGQASKQRGKAPRDVGYPGAADSRSESKDRTQSAP
jgi:hypothetical protein